MSHIYTIYKATNTINGKCYIGYTNNYNKRKQTHIIRFSNTKSSEYSKLFHRAIRKYGKENFQWSILYQSNDMDFTKNIMESYMIKQYNSYYHWENGGYNMTLGGDGTQGNKHTIIWKNNHSIRMSGNNNPFYNKQHTDKTKLQMSNKKLGKIPWNKNIPQKEESKLLNADAHSEYWIISDMITGHYQIIKNLQNFCKIKNLGISSLRNVDKGRQLQYKGLICNKLSL